MLHCPTCGRHYSPGVTVCPEDNTTLQADSTVIGAAKSSANTTSTIDPLIGRTLDGKYRVEERLGVGGMGTVYKARHLLIDREVAIKVLNQRFIEDDAARTRFHREARAAGRLQHPNAVTVTDFGQTSDGYVYIVMELLVGRTLRDILGKEAPLDAARAVSLMLQISDAVAAAHEAGVIHRDLKPANIFIVQRADIPAAVKVLDFGIAKLATEFLDDDDSQTLTVVGAMIGTPRYMSPEQCEGAELTPAADVYSLGVILYEMLTGSVPFSGSTPLSIALKHSAEKPRRPREIVQSIPDDLERIVLQALEKNPRDRPADAAKFRRELFETAERLGLEGAAITSGPDLQALRGMGTESPSGRLVINLSRLRENRAATTSAGDLTVINEKSNAGNNGGSKPSLDVPRSFPRVAVPLQSRRKINRAFWIVPIVLLGLIVGAIFFAVRLIDNNPSSTLASPSPTASATPTPAATPERTQKRAAQEPAATPTPTNTNGKKGSKVGSFFKKAGRILKKPF